MESWLETGKVILSSMVLLSVMAALTVMFLRKFPLITEDEFEEQATEVNRIKKEQKKKEEIKNTLEKVNRVRKWLEFQQASLLFQNPNLPPSTLTLPALNYMLDQFIHSIDNPPAAFMFSQPKPEIKKKIIKKTQ
jgi:hypothetical protein